MIHSPVCVDQDKVTLRQTEDTGRVAQIVIDYAAMTVSYTALDKTPDAEGDVWPVGVDHTFSIKRGTRAWSFTMGLSLEFEALHYHAAVLMLTR